ncbi:HNH endonuclease [Christiangramia forsetii]|uniref:HNH nuclease domain-containing protein n=2 Tax=Christiangramia forsetii TaxID=411153 RepID=A0LZR8_CHRFK|nr:HNH endonuclease signature motif containing protein [Christiangramia forsetii]GGG46550.1 hypothetical protein GCM10011532_33050 [Christiangramia forsetii]CAL65863.1 conserved hypothetical protein [Christiangramia forsetii KT0803]
MTNKFGLKRSIPNPIKRIIRQNSGFGCVICGLGIFQYEHVDPEFHNSKEHDPEKMTLLCPRCHNKVTTQFWSKEKVKLAMKNPKPLQQGYSNEIFDIGQKHPEIRFAGSILKNCQIPIMINGLPVFKIDSPENENGYFQLSGNFFDSNGIRTLVIENNEWFSNSENWDLEVIGSSLIIREKMGEIALKLTVNPPNIISVEKIKMRIKNITIIGNESEFSLFDSITNKPFAKMQNCIADHCRVGFNFN